MIIHWQKPSTPTSFYKIRLNKGSIIFTFFSVFSECFASAEVKRCRNNASAGSTC